MSARILTDAKMAFDVIPAQAGIQKAASTGASKNWIPACAGMTPWRMAIAEAGHRAAYQINRRGAGDDGKREATTILKEEKLC